MICLDLVFVLLWNSGFIGAEYGLPYTGPWTLLLWRNLALSGLLGVWPGRTVLELSKVGRG